MLHPWIKIKDVLDLIEDMQRIDGMISKRDFQKALLKCREHKQPLEKIERIKSYKVRNANEIIGHIHDYKRHFKGGVFLHGLKRRQQTTHRRSFAGIDFENGNIEIYHERLNSRVKLYEADTIFDDLEVETTMIQILKISGSTYKRWVDNGIIRLITGDVIVKLNNREISCMMMWYSLNDIKKNIQKHR